MRTTAIKKAKSALRDSERRLESELNIVRRLHAMTMAVSTAASMQDAFNRILETAIELHAADFGSIQLLEPKAQQLRTVAQRGFDPVMVGRFELMGIDDLSACGRAARTGTTCQIADVLMDDYLVKYRDVAVEFGYRAVQCTPLINRNGDIVGVLSVHFRNVHAFCEQDQQLGDMLARQAADLIESKRAVEQLREARNEADRANRAKSAFLATASHDLRQPLQALSMLNATLRQQVTDPESIKAVAQQETSILAMSRLTNALLDISKLESGAVKPEPTGIDIATLLAEVRKEFAELAANKGLHLEVELQAEWARSDIALLGQVLRNLVSNAIKYTAEGRVVLRCVQQGTTVRVEVADTGVGIPRDALARIFDEFYQIEVPTNKARDGYGLGLSIVRRIADLLGLKVEVQSEPCKGSSFSIELPAAAATTGERINPERAAPRRARSSNGKRKILLVEDDAAVRDATRLLLKTAGYTVTTAHALADATERAAEDPGPDILITDYHLGSGGTGRQVIESVRRICGSRIKAVMITGDTSSSVPTTDHDDDLWVMSKPIEAARLLQLLDNLLVH